MSGRYIGGRRTRFILTANATRRRILLRKCRYTKNCSRLSKRWPRRNWNWIFSKVPCEESRLDARRVEALARRHLRRNRNHDVAAKHLNYRAHVPVGPGEPCWLLPIPPTRCSSNQRRDGSAISDSADCPG